MPLPWKNNNVPRISRIVADLQSPKRGGSLVVETGFPTSLIDLFVKNRSRFKRRKSKRLSDPILTPVPPAPPPSPPEYLTFDDGSTTVMRLVRETAREAVAQSDRVADGSGPETAVFAILKILTAIVLTLSVKKLTVGITMSAFALLFLEFVGKQIVCRLDFLKRTRSNAITAFSSLSRGISCCFRKNCEASLEQEGIIHEEEISGSGLVGDEVVEIEVVEPNYVDANINLEATDSLNRDDEWICSEMKDNFVEQHCEISECTAKGKRCHKLKSKMMKILVPRKLRSSKEEKKEKKSKNKEAKSNSEKLKEHISVVPLLESTKDKDGGIICSRDSSMTKEVVDLMSVSGDGRRRRRESESSGYVMLIVIALAGLGGGRILALVFIMAWCFILKLVRKRGRSVRTSFS